MNAFDKAVAKIHKREFAKKIWDLAVLIAAVIVFVELYAAL